MPEAWVEKFQPRLGARDEWPGKNMNDLRKLILKYDPEADLEKYPRRIDLCDRLTELYTSLLPDEEKIKAPPGKRAPKKEKLGRYKEPAAPREYVRREPKEKPLETPANRRDYWEYLVNSGNRTYENVPDRKILTDILKKYKPTFDPGERVGNRLLTRSEIIARIKKYKK